MKYIQLEIPEVKLMEPEVFGDDRGYFMETWRAAEFKKQVADVSFVQENHSKSGQGILRGLHYQIKQAQGKLIRVTSGSVFDVAVDIRKSSSTFGKWVGVTLSDENKKLLWVPPGFAHGFFVISDQAEFTYKCTDYYAPEYERSILWNDPKLAIDWPLEQNSTPLISQKDKEGILLAEAEVYS